MYIRFHSVHVMVVSPNMKPLICWNREYAQNSWFSYEAVARPGAINGTTIVTRDQQDNLVERQSIVSTFYRIFICQTFCEIKKMSRACWLLYEIIVRRSGENIKLTRCK